MQDAYINGIRLDVETMGEGYKKALAVHEFPFKDNALIQDMGLSARRIQLRCYFYNDRYDLHRTFLVLLNDRKSFELQHPDHGLLSGIIETVSIRKDDRKKTAEVDIEFIEGITSGEVIIVPDVEVATDHLYGNGLEGMEYTFIDQATAALGPDAKDILESEIDDELTILEQFSNLGKEARAWVKKVSTAVSTIDATLNEVASPANALISTITFASNIPGRVIGSVARVANRYATLVDTVRNAPERFVNSFKDGIAGLENSVFPKHAKAERSIGNIGKTSVNPYTPDPDDADTHVWNALKTATALEAGHQTAVIFAEDQTRREFQKQSEATPSFDVRGNYVKAGAAPLASGRELQALLDGNIDTLPQVMNVREIEATLYVVREIIQIAIEDSRPGDNLKKLAAQLVVHVNQIKLDRENITRVSLDNAMPMHLVCLRYGLPYQAAERICAINPTIAQPNFTRGAIDIYVR